MFVAARVFNISHPVPRENGIKAAKGAACIIINIGEINQSFFSLIPMHKPRIIPKKAEIAIPRNSGRKVSEYAINIEPFKIIEIKASIVSKKVGNAKLIGTLPAISQAVNKKKAELIFNIFALEKLILFILYFF